MARWLDPRDLAAWDAFVARHPQGFVYHTSRWKNALERAFPHIRGHILTLSDTGGRIRAGWPVYVVRSWLLGTRIITIPFAAVGDVLTSSADDAVAMWPHVQSLVERESARCVELRGLRTTGVLEATWGLRADYHHHYRDLSGDEDALKQSCSKTAVRQLITKAERTGIRVERGTTESDVRRFYELYSVTRKRLNLPPMPLRFFRAMMACLGPERCFTLLAYRDGDLAAGAFVIADGRVASLEHTGEHGWARNSGAGQLVCWEAIRHSKRAGCQVFSFGRTPRDHQGLADYKRRWGMAEEALSVAAWDSRGDAAPSRETRSSYRLMQRIAGAAPLPVSRVIGEFCYSHWG